jgi:hypothetical protein
MTALNQRRVLLHHAIEWKEEGPRRVAMQDGKTA